MLHLTDIKKYECRLRTFWLSRRQKKGFVPFVNYNENINGLVKRLLMIREEDALVGQANDSGKLALQVLHKKKVLIHARFVYEDLGINVPFLVQEDDRRTLYFAYRSCFPKEYGAVRTAQCLAVLGKPGVSIDAVYTIHLDAAYVRGRELGVRQLLIVNEYLYNGENRAHKAIRELLNEREIDLDAMLGKLHTCKAMDDISIRRNRVYTRGGKCMYYDGYFPEVPAGNFILNLVQAAQRYEVHEEGITTLRDADIDRTEGTRYQYAQIIAARNHGPYVDKGALRCWKKIHIQTPISYLDLEWKTYAFPPCESMKPFDVLVFQYSLHIEE